MSIVLRIDKGAPLTNAELDANFADLSLTRLSVGGDIGGGTSAPVVVSLRGNAVSTATPTTGQTLTWSGAAWAPTSPAVINISSVVTSVVTSTITNSVSSTVTSTAISTINTGTTTYPSFSAYPNSSVQQTITSGSQQKILWQNEEFDVGGCFANSRFTPNVEGYYQLNAVARMSGTLSTGESMIVIWKNGSEYKRGWNQSGTEVGASFLSMQVSALVYADGVDDYFEVYIQQTSGSGRDITVAHAAGVGNITWFNGTYVPTQLITSITSETTVSSTVASAVGGAVSSIVVTTSVAGLSNVVTVLDDLSPYFNNVTSQFTLKEDRVAIVEGINYVDNRDIQVTIGFKQYRPFFPQSTTLGPWHVDYKDYGRTYDFRVSGSTIKFNRAIESRQGADIRINTVSSSRKIKSRYPFSANSIALGD